MTIKTWEQRRQELIDKGADAGYIGPMHAEIGELRAEIEKAESEFAEHVAGLHLTIDELSKECGQLAEAGVALRTQVAELREALQESEDFAIKAAMEYEKLKSKAAILRESNAFISLEREDAIEELAKLKLGV